MVELAYTMKASEVTRAIEACILAREPFYLEGDPGIGKTAVVNQTVARMGIGFQPEDAATAESADVRGVPFPLNGRTTWLPPATFPLDPDAGLILVFVDEFAQAPEPVKNAWGRVINERQVGTTTIPPNVLFGAAGNYLKNRAGVTGRMPTQVADRFTRLHMRVDLNDWIKHGLSRGFDNRVIAYHLARRGKYLQDFDPARDVNATPRGWERVSNLMKANPDQDILLRIIAGRVGDTVAGEFTAFCKVLPKVPSIEAIVLNPGKVTVPEEPDVQTVLAVNIAHAMTPTNADPLVKYIGRMPAEFSVLAMKLATRRDETLTETGAFTGWAVDKGDFLA